MTENTYVTTDQLDRRLADRRPTYRFAGRSRRDWERWRVGLLGEIVRLFGPFDRPKGPPSFDVVETTEHPKYVRRKIVYETRLGEPVPAWLCTPREMNGRAPGVLCIHGHGPHGKDALVDEECARGSLPFAAALAEAGCVTLAPDHAGMGERDGGGGCELLTRRLNHLGRDVTAHRVFDLVRATDLLAALPEVDERHIGNAGFSLGCWLAQVHAAVDERVQASVQSGRFTTFAQTNWQGRCICQHTKGIGAVCEIPDVAGLIAPRPVAAEWGDEDTPRAVQPAFDMAREIWRAAGAEDRLALFTFAGNHRFDGTQSIPWLVDRLRRTTQNDR